MWRPSDSPDKTEARFAANRNRKLTRRSLLRCGAGIAVATPRCRAAFAADEATSPVMDRLSQYMSEAGDRALPPAVADQVKDHILDTLAAMISGSELPPGHQALQFARAVGGEEKIATVVASNIQCGPIEAAIVNGALAQADETDDNYSAGGAHPGCAVVPAALAMGERDGIDGMRFLRAIT